MPSLVQICVVIVTLAFVSLVATTIVAMMRLGEAAAQLTSAAQASMAQGERIVQEIRELLASMREIMPPAQRVVNRLERLGERAAALSTAVLDEIEEPVFTAVAVARRVRTGTGYLFDLLTRPFAQRRSSINGGQDHE
jgi:uncharacterized protein YoxC